MQTTGEISLYFHIPFCNKKCPYCHFYSIPFDPALKGALLNGLTLELLKRKEGLANKKIVSIYFGGGTPSLLDAEDIFNILSLISNKEICEVTLEINPQIDKQKLLSFNQSGINRLSIGVQSFHDPTLLSLGRTHSAKASIECIENANHVGFSNISIDLIYDTPKQNMRSWKMSLKETLKLPITHISLYNLTIEEKTLFFKRKNEISPLLPSPNLSLKLLIEALQAFESANFSRYEISAFAKDNKYSRHNLGYWIGREFFGFGPSAFSFFQGKRFQNHDNLKKYLADLNSDKFPIGFIEELTYPDNIKELLTINLRVLEGFSIKKFNLPEESLMQIEKLKNDGFLEIVDEKYRLTNKGILFYDSVAEHLI